MSTRIYTGCEIVGHTLESFLPLAQRLQPALAEIAQVASRQFVMRAAVYQFDRHHLGLAAAERPRSFIGQAFEDLLDRQNEVERTGRRDGCVDFAVDVTLFPIPRTRAAPARLLAMSFIEHPELRKCWTAQPFWRDFSYWDNTDEPDDLPRRVWSERKRLWKKVFPDSQPPSQRGYSLNLLRPGNAYHAMDDTALHPHLPTVEERAHVMVDFFAKEMPPEVVAALGDRLPSASRDDKREAIKTYLLTRLAPELTLDLLRGRATLPLSS